MGLKRALFDCCFQGKCASTSSDEFVENFTLPIFPYHQLEVATNNFHSDNCIGKGTIVKTYYGKLKDGRQIAVKRFHLKRERDQFLSNIQIFSMLPHKNLVSIYGYVFHKKECLLVHEYISNGTLLDHLHCESKGRSTLPWLIRLNIAIDIASALAVLHCKGIIHGNIKSSNVHLDEKFSAKVGILDLSRDLTEVPDFVSDESSDVVEPGTLHYIDPYYQAYGQLSLNTDVYSFGVVLCQLISSQRIYNLKKNGASRFLPTFAINKVKNQALDELLDSSVMKKMITAVAKLANHCLRISPNERPSMEQVLHTLIDIRLYGINPMTDGDLDQENNAYKNDVFEVATPNDDSSVKYQFQVFGHDELDEATNHFDNCLGKGGFGTVYYGKLQDGREVAIKRCHEMKEKTMRQFMKEIEILGLLRHQNLVSLYGCCSEHSDRLLLVYEYVSNGTLAFHLHQDNTSQLTWLTRLNIAIETATTLAYLHKSGIIHRDVKATNILLDKNFRVKIGDFGLSRDIPAYVSHVSTDPVGTRGYLDPEYYESGKVSDKSDVYSFGVVLLELISSKPPTFMLGRRQHALAYFATTKIMNKELEQLVDPSLGFDSYSKIRESITTVAELAFQCLQCPKVLRPSMQQVLKTLQGIKQGTWGYTLSLS